MDKEKQIERLIRFTLSDFRVKLTDNFFAYYLHEMPEFQDLARPMAEKWAKEGNVCSIPKAFKGGERERKELES